ncbi:MAG: T9SS type A sorting domain-containing protein [Chitinophagales bacterium]|nr:T9SS type A sorting domain-containing protein [Chitinophagales bacterium]
MKTLTLFSALIFSSLLSFSQEIIEWQMTLGGVFSDKQTCSVATQDGGVLVGGHSSSIISGNKTEDSKGDADFWVVKISEIGIVEWQKVFGGNKNDFLLALIQTTDGGYLLAGSSLSDSSGDKTSATKGADDYWVVRIDKEGALLWEKSFGGTGNEYIYAITNSNDGGFVVGGISNSNNNGDKLEESMGGFDLWMIKCDAQGNIQWQNSIGTASDDFISSVEQTNDGDYVLGCYSYSTNISPDKSEAGFGPDYWVIKLNSEGQIEWENTIVALDEDVLTVAHQTNDGGYILGGYSNSKAGSDKSEYSWVELNDYWIVKLDSAGEIVWENTISAGFNDTLTSIYEYDNGEYLVMGSSTSNYFWGIEKTEDNNGGADFWMLKLNAEGELIWQATIGGCSEEYGGAAFQTKDGKVIITGTSNSGNCGDKDDVCYGFTDYWVMKVLLDYNIITGSVFYDFDKNGILDNNDFSVPNLMVQEATTGKLAITNKEGAYTIAVTDSGDFSTSVISPLFVAYEFLPENREINFNTDAGLTVSENNFGITPSYDFADLSVTLTSVSIMRAGQSCIYSAHILNTGTQPTDGDLILTFDTDLLTYTSSNVQPVSMANNEIVFPITALPAFTTTDVQITFLIKTSAPFGQQFEASAIVATQGTIDPFVFNDTCHTNDTIVASYDPNDISVDRGFILSSETSNPPELNYIIRFQNTGNDTAFNIKVVNKLSQYVDLSSFVLIDNSDTVEITLNQFTHELEFSFANIHLPDSNVNEIESHGFVRYKIMPNPGLLINDSISTYADIYFDYNDAVKTNDALTVITEPTLVETIPSDHFPISIYPNPATNIVAIRNPTLSASSLSVLNVSGQVIYFVELSTDELHQINIDKWNSGIYFIQMVSETETAVAKLVKN